MRNGKLKGFARRGMSMLLAALMVAPFGMFAPTAQAAETTPVSSTTNFVIWDWIDNIQKIGKDADCANPDATYSRILFYLNAGGDRYYFNASPDGGTKSGDWYTTYYEDQIYLDANSRVGASANKEWGDDLASFDHFITVGGVRTPYLQWGEVKQGYQSWRLWVANKDDTRSDFTLCLADDYEDLDIRRTYGGFAEHYAYYGADNDRIRTDPWIIDKHCVIACAANYKTTHDNFAIWHWDNDSGGINEALDFDLSGRKYWANNVRSRPEVETFKIYLGREYDVPTMSQNFTVSAGQITTLGRPLYYIPKGRVLTIEKDGILSVDGMLLNDGEIRVEDGGLLILKDGAKIMPMTKYDSACGKITSYGSIVIEEDSLLSAGASNGIRIKGGGVINFGTIAGEYIDIDQSYAIDNRDSGYVIAGWSPSPEARIRYIRAAIGDQEKGVTEEVDAKNDFTKVAKGKSHVGMLSDSIYGNVDADHVQIYADATTAGNPTDPKLTVYTRSTPSDSYGEPLFKQKSLRDVSLRVEGDSAEYTVDGTKYPIKNQLVAAVIERGEAQEKLFTDMWVGSLDGAYVQFEPGSAEGSRLSAAGGKNALVTSGTAATIRKADDSKDQWWHLTGAGKVNGQDTYYIDTVASAKNTTLGLDLPNVNSASNGNQVLLYNHSDNGNDQRWVFEQNNGTTYFLRNAANTSVSLAVAGDSSKDGSAVLVSTNSVYASGQYWNIVNLLTEAGYASAATLGCAMEFIPQNAPTMRMALPANSAAGTSVSIRTSDPAANAQRWRLDPVGTDHLDDGSVTTYYRIVEMNTELALAVSGSTLTDVRDKVSVVASTATASGSVAELQYWYLTPSGGTDQYYVVPRGNSGLALSAPNADEPASGSALTVATRVKGAAYQQWEVTGADEAIAEAEAETSEDQIADKIFELEPSTRTGQRIAIDSSGLDGLVLQIATDKAGTDDARWTFQRLGTDTVSDAPQPYYQIISKSKPNFALGFGTQKIQHATRLAQETADADNRKQHWYVTENEDGTYTVAPREAPSLVLGIETTRYGTYFSLVSQENSTYTKTNWNLIADPPAPLDGKTYTLSPQHAPDMVAGVEGRSDSDGANVELQAAGTTSTEQIYQQWKFEKKGTDTLDGVAMAYYTIKNVGSDKVFDLPSTNNAKSGQSVKLYGSDGYADQEWFVVETDDGYFNLVNRNNTGICLDASGSGTTAGTDVIVYTWKSGNENQKWKLAYSETIDRFDGRVVYLSPKHTGTDMVLDLCGNGTANGTQVQIYDKKETEIQRWRFERLGVDYLNGVKCNYYAIYSVYADGKALDTSGSTSNGARPHLWDYSASNKNQQWYVMHAGDGYYYIVPRSDTTKYLGVAGGLKTNNAAVELWNSSGDNRQWKLTETIAPETLGTYSILPKHAPGMHVGPASSNSDNGTKLIIWEYNESSNYARWTFVKMGTDGKGAYYKIVNMANGKVIDATGINTIQADSQLQQWDSDFNNDQLWYLNDAGQDENGIQYYNIVNRSDTNYCMSVSGGSTTHGTGVTVSKKNGGDSQKFRLMERFEPVELGTYEFGNPDAISMRLTVAGGSASDGANIILYARHTNNANAGGKLQQFKIIQRGNDVVDGVKTPYYSIENLNGGKVLDPTGNANVSDGTNVLQWSYDGFSDQHWYMEVREDSSVVFRCRADSRLVLTATGTNSDDNVALKTYDEQNLGRQSWQLHPIMQTNADGQYYIPGNKAAVAAGIPFAKEEDVILNPAVGGKYTLAPQHAATSRMDLAGGNTGNGTRIQLYGNHGNDNQRWQFVPMGVDYYDGGGKIFYKLAFGSNANKVAQIDGYGPVTASKNVSLYDDQGCYDDEWYLEPVGGKEDTYYIIGRGTWSQEKKICLGVPSGATADQTQLQTATLQNKNYQQWQLEYVD